MSGLPPAVQTLALLLVVLSGLWLVWVGVFVSVKPVRALEILGKMASSYRINFTEQGLRLLAGIALVVRAEASKVAGLFSLLGWFVVGSSALLLVLPLRWHARYAVRCSELLNPTRVRLLAPVSVALGVLLIHAAL